jgi:hypothetical protein
MQSRGVCVVRAAVLLRQAAIVTARAVVAGAVGLGAFSRWYGQPRREQRRVPIHVDARSPAHMPFLPH